MLTLDGQIIDSRDLIEWLENEYSPTGSDDEDQERAREIEEASQGISDWEYGATLIREDYFPEYAEELAYDIGAIPRDMEYSWPFTHINWDEAADALLQDYVDVQYQGWTYYVRA